MSKEQKFFICKHCGNLVGMIFASGAPMTCCGEKMTELVANTTDAATEKHVPVVTVEGKVVTAVVGSVEHPMLPEHYIQWIYLQTTKGGYRRALEPGQKPHATFTMQDDEEAVAVFEYCNLHGLWKTEL